MALPAILPWNYFHASVQATARTALRALMGTSYASSPTDALMDAALSRAVSYVHGTTGRFFLLRTGTLLVNGTGGRILDVPYPVVSVGQGGTGITSVTVEDDSTAMDTDLYSVRDGAGMGMDADDPRNYPQVILKAGKGDPQWPGSYGVWPYGIENVTLVGDFGYLEPDGSTPPLILSALARLTILQTAPLDDDDARADRVMTGIKSETVQGRAYTLGEGVIGGGITTEREIDQILAHYRRPPRVRAGRPRRMGRTRYY